MNLFEELVDSLKKNVEELVIFVEDGFEEVSTKLNSLRKLSSSQSEIASSISKTSINLASSINKDISPNTGCRGQAAARRGVGSETSTAPRASNHSSDSLSHNSVIVEPEIPAAVPATQVLVPIRTSSMAKKSESIYSSSIDSTCPSVDTEHTNLDTEPVCYSSSIDLKCPSLDSDHTHLDTEPVCYSYRTALRIDDEPIMRSSRVEDWFQGMGM